MSVVSKNPVPLLSAPSRNRNGGAGKGRSAEKGVDASLPPRASARRRATKKTLSPGDFVEEGRRAGGDVASTQSSQLPP